MEEGRLPELTLRFSAHKKISSLVSDTALSARRSP
jgi:hypothetical protein